MCYVVTPVNPDTSAIWDPCGVLTLPQFADGSCQGHNEDVSKTEKRKFNEQTCFTNARPYPDQAPCMKIWGTFLMSTRCLEVLLEGIVKVHQARHFFNK
jgi:hypothetical protein